MYEDPAWDEYLSTGEDPTGGALEEADSPSCHSQQLKRPSKENPPKGCSPIGIILSIVLILFLVIGNIITKSNERKEAERKEREHQESIQRAQEWRRHEDEAYRLYKEMEAEGKKAQAEQFRKEVAARSKAIREAKKQQSGNIVYDYRQGYHDGYECGYDDGDCNEGYGYSYLDDSTLSKYGSDYRKGFHAGYRKGFDAGKEDYQYSEGI